MIRNKQGTCRCPDCPANGRSDLDRALSFAKHGLEMLSPNDAALRRSQHIVGPENDLDYLVALRPTILVAPKVSVLEPEHVPEFVHERRPFRGVWTQKDCAIDGPQRIRPRCENHAVGWEPLGVRFDVDVRPSGRDSATAVERGR